MLEPDSTFNGTDGTKTSISSCTVKYITITVALMPGVVLQSAVICLGNQFSETAVSVIFNLSYRKCVFG